MITETKTPWQNDLDAKKYLLDVHSQEFKKILGTDYKLAKFSEGERKFIIEMVSAGIGVIDICPNPDIAMQIKEMDFHAINALSILKFNVNENMALINVMSGTTEKPHEEEGNVMQQLKKQLQSDLEKGQ